MPDLFMNFQSGVLTADPGTSGTTLNSGNFAFLPAVVAPNVLRLVLDPDGLTGTPEIVVVTAHTASATSLTVTRGQETAFGAGAARTHAVDSVWRHTLTRANIIELTVPAGSIISTIAAAAPTGFLLLDGSTVSGGQTIYPNLWAVIPAGWKSGANIALPDARGRTVIGAGSGAGLTTRTLSGLVGEESHVLTPAETAVKGHGHSVTDPGHFHQFSVDQRGSATGLILNYVATGSTTNTTTTTTGLTVVSLADGANGAAHNVMQPSIALNWIVKT